MRTFLKITAVFLLLYLCLGAIYGSWMLVSDPTGAKFNMPVDLLKNTPFRNYLVPGIILLIVNGLFPIYIVISVLLNLRNNGWLLIAQGCLLIGWLSFELIFNKDFFIPVLHYSLYMTGILLISAGYWFKKREKNNHLLRSVWQR